MTTNIGGVWQWAQPRVRAATVMVVLVLAGVIPGAAGDISYVYDNLGRLLAGIWVSGTSANFPTKTLAATGTSTLFINPQGASSGSLSVQITSP